MARTGPQPGAHAGSGGFIIQRATSVLLIPLGLWLAWSLVSLAGAPYDTVRAFMASTPNALLLAAFVGVSALHMRGGMADVILDYFDGTGRQVLRLLNTILAIAVTAAAWWGLYRLAV